MRMWRQKKGKRAEVFSSLPIANGLLNFNQLSSCFLLSMTFDLTHNLVMEMSHVIALHREWQATASTSCTCRAHYSVSGEPIEDVNVCRRERAWRRYADALTTYLDERKEERKNVLELDFKKDTIRPNYRQH